jgi:hypothetical protein
MISFVIGAVLATVITMMVYAAARLLNSPMAYVSVIILPMIFSIIAWGILYFLFQVSAWFLAGATFAVFLVFVLGLICRFISPGWAYAIVFLVPIVLSFIIYGMSIIIKNLWGVVNA